MNELDSRPALGLQRNGYLATDGDNGGRIYVASVSPQSRASIAATYGVTETEAGYMIEQLLSGPKGIKSRAVYRNGFQWVVDTNVAREACLVLGAEEVLGPMDGETGAGITEEKQPTKPILTSSCPGWICYVEKSHPYVLPHLSRLKSPQALMGTLLKTTLSRKLGISPDRIWHVAVMPCFDKKLEASREELTDAVWEGTGTRGVRDVDCVITSKELLLLADSRRVDFAALPRTPLSTPRVSFPDPVLDSFLFPSPRRVRKNGSPAAGSSGGNLHYILESVVSRHQGSSLSTVRGRVDVVEYTVTAATGEVLFRAARYYGFRNIQNLVRRFQPARPSRMPGGRPVGAARKTTGKSGGKDFSYIEVMACPGGCTNGGGQIKIDDPILAARRAEEAKPGPQEQKEWLAHVDEAYFSGEDNTVEKSQGSSDPGDVVCGVSPSYIKDIMKHWAISAGIDLDRLAYTTYRAVISDVGKKPEAERVIEIAGKIGGGW